MYIYMYMYVFIDKKKSVVKITEHVHVPPFSHFLSSDNAILIESWQLRNVE